MIVSNEEEIEDKTHFIRWETSYKINGIFQNSRIMKGNLELFQIEGDRRARQPFSIRGTGRDPRQGFVKIFYKGKWDNWKKNEYSN